MRWKILILLSITLFQFTDAFQSNLSNLRREPYDWEHVLRELIFKTISPSPLGNNNLYKQLLKAPFYKSFPSSTSSEQPVTLLSTGSVFFLPINKWILCENNCRNCSECLNQKYPSIKWILKRIKASDIRYDLQFTITPQIDGSFHMKNVGLQSFVYIVPEYNKSSIKSVQKKKLHQFDKFNAESNETYELTLNADLRFQKRNHNGKLYIPENNESELDVFGDTETDMFDNSVNNSSSLHSHLILGTDKLGMKYLIQIVLAYNSKNDNNEKSNSGSSVINSRSYATSSSPRSSYHDIVQCVVSSLNNNKQFIQTFLTDDEQFSSTKNMVKDDLKRNNFKIAIENKFNNSMNEMRKEESLELKTSDAKTDIQQNKNTVTERSFVKHRIPRLNRSKNGWNENNKQLNKTHDKVQESITFGYF